jgi:hypothetical protein
VLAKANRPSLASIQSNIVAMSARPACFLTSLDNGKQLDRHRAKSTINERGGVDMIRKLRSGDYRLYSRKKNLRTGKRTNLGTFKTKAAAKKHERAVQYFKRR